MSEEIIREKEFDAFISYSRRDTDFAKKLLTALEDFDPPEIDGKRLKKLDIFLDSEDLEGGGDYYKTIDKKLAKSNKLIVICSPESRKSKFVNDEIQKFTKKNSPLNILPILVDGIPNNQATPENEHLKAFPESLVEALEMPLAVSFVDTDWRKLSFTKDILRGAWYSILAKMYDINRDKIERRDIEKRKRKRNQRIFLLSVFLLTIAGLFVWGVKKELKNKRLLAFDNSYTQAKIFEEKAGRSAQQQSVSGYQKAWLYTLAALKQNIDTTDTKKNLKESKARLQRKAISIGASIEQQLWVSPLSPDKTEKLIVSPSGLYTATTHKNGKIFLWNNQRGEQIYSWLSGTINSLSFSPDDQYMISCSDSVLTLWSIDQDFDTVTKVKTHKDKGISLVSINPDSKIAAYCASDTIKYWKFDCGFIPDVFCDTLKIGIKGTKDIKQLAFTPGGAMIFVSGKSGTNKVELENKSRNDINTDIKIAVASTKNIIAYVDSNNIEVNIWNFEQNRLLKINEEARAIIEMDSVEHLAFNKTADKLAIALSGEVLIISLTQESEWKLHTKFKETTIISNTISFLADDRVVAATEKNRIVVWNKDGEKVASTLGHNSDVNTLAFHPHPDSTILASGADDGTIILWDFKTGREKKRVQHFRGVIRSLDFLSNGDSLVVSLKNKFIGLDEKSKEIFGNGFVYIWNIKNNTYDVKYEGLKNVMDIAIPMADEPINRNSKIVIALNLSQYNLKIWDYKSGEKAILEGHTRGVRRVAFNPKNQNEFASVSDDKTICLWDADSVKKNLQWKGHAGKIFGIAWRPNGEYIATASTDETIRLWDMKEIKEKLGPNSSGKEKDCLLFGDKLEIRFANDIWYIPKPKIDKKEDILWTVIFSEKNKALAYKHIKDSTIKYIKLNKPKILRGHLDEVWDVDFSPDGNLLVSGSGDFGIRLWHVDTGVEIGRLGGHNKDVFSVKFNHDKDNTLIASGSFDHSIRLWDLSTIYNPNYIKTFENSVRTIAISNDQRYLVYGGLDKQLYIDEINYENRHLNRVSAKKNIPFDYSSGYNILSIAFHPNNHLLAYGTTNNEVKFWDIQPKSKRINIPKIRVGGDVLSLNFNSDGSSVAAALSNGELKLWNIDPSKNLVSLDTVLSKKSSSKARSVSFSPSGNYLAAGFSSSNKSIFLWEKEKTDTLWRGINLGHHSDGVWAVAFSPDSKYLASGSWDSSIRIWDLTNKQKLLTLRGHRGPVTSLVFLDNNTIISGSWDHTIRLWDRESGNELDVINAHGGTVYSLVVDPSGSFLVSGSADKSLRFHEINPSEKLQKNRTLKQYANLLNAYQFMLPFRLEGDELRDSEPNYFLSPFANKEDPFQSRKYSKWMLEPRPQNKDVLEWISADKNVDE